MPPAGVALVFEINFDSLSGCKGFTRGCNQRILPFDLVNQLSSRPRRGNLVLAGSRAADLCHFTPLASEIQRGKRSKRTRVLSSLGPSGPSCFSPYLAELSSETAAMRSWTGLLCQNRYCSPSFSSGS